MIKFLKGQSRFLYRDTAGKEHFEAMLVCDTAAELAGVTEVKGVVLDFGSVAYAVQNGAFYVLDSSGTWCSSEDGAAPAVASALNMSLLKTDISGVHLPDMPEQYYTDDAQPLDTAESEVTADDLTVGRAESE